MQQQMARDWEKIIKSLILLCFSSLLFYLVIGGQIRMYINPRFTVLSELAAVVLLSMSAVQFFNWRSSCHVHDHKAPHKLVYVIFVIPLALFLLLPDAALNASVASNRGLNFNSGNSASAGRPLGAGPERWLRHLSKALTRVNPQVNRLITQVSVKADQFR